MGDERLAFNCESMAIWSVYEQLRLGGVDVAQCLECVEGERIDRWPQETMKTSVKWAMGECSEKKAANQ